MGQRTVVGQLAPCGWQAAWVRETQEALEEEQKHLEQEKGSGGTSPPSFQPVSAKCARSLEHSDLGSAESLATRGRRADLRTSKP